MRPSIRNSDKEERAIFYQIMRCMQLPLARSDTLVGWTRRTRTQPERVALPIPSNIVLSSQFPVPCSFNPVRNRNRNPTQRTYNLSASNGNQTVTGRVSEKGDERERESATATTITMPAIPIRIKMLPLRMRMCQQRKKGRAWTRGRRGQCCECECHPVIVIVVLVPVLVLQRGCLSPLCIFFARCCKWIRNVTQTTRQRVKREGEAEREGGRVRRQQSRKSKRRSKRNRIETEPRTPEPSQARPTHRAKTKKQCQSLGQIPNQRTRQGLALVLG